MYVQVYLFIILYPYLIATNIIQYLQYLVVLVFEYHVHTNYSTPPLGLLLKYEFSIGSEHLIPDRVGSDKLGGGVNFCFMPHWQTFLINFTKSVFSVLKTL